MSTTPPSEPALQPASTSGVPGPEPRGLIVLDKPQGITSRKALNVVKRRLNLGPLGHCGSLDPLATGVLVVCVGKSTIARCGLIVNVTPLEPEWRGRVTLEISNTTPLPAKLYANEGIAQLLFFRGAAPCKSG